MAPFVFLYGIIIITTGCPCWTLDTTIVTGWDLWTLCNLLEWWRSRMPLPTRIQAMVLKRGGHDDLVWRLQTEFGGGLWRWWSFSDVWRNKASGQRRTYMWVWVFEVFFLFGLLKHYTVAGEIIYIRMAWTELGKYHLLNTVILLSCIYTAGKPWQFGVKVMIFALFMIPNSIFFYSIFF